MFRLIGLIAIFTAVNGILCTGQIANNVAYAQNFTGNVKCRGTLQRAPAIQPPPAEITIGERLEYSAEWIGIPAGKIILTVEGIENISGKECYHIVAKAIPNSFFAKFYDMEYAVHTYMDKKALYPRRFEKTKRAKDKISHETVIFDRENKKAISKMEGENVHLRISPLRDKMEKDIGTTSDIMQDTQDMLSSLYMLRLMKLEPGNSYPLSIYQSRRNWRVNIKVETPYIREIRKKGTLVVFGVTISSELNEFILGKRRISAFFTADSRRLPIEFRFGTGIGAVRGIIQNLDTKK